jgi:hypothetical protein
MISSEFVKKENYKEEKLIFLQSLTRAIFLTLENYFTNLNSKKIILKADPKSISLKSRSFMLINSKGSFHS